MKAHTIGFKNAVKELGRQLRAVITYGNVTIEEEIYAVTPHFEGGILKSIMKQLDLELSVNIPLETVINCQIGILVNGSYEMLNFGNYVVYKSEKQEDTNTYKLTCYDKMLYSMKQNEELGITYPISIKNYLTAICNKLGLTLRTTTFQNESRMIQNELYLGLDYTYRDILDEIAQATGSIICLNENDEVLVKYPTQTNDTIDEEFLKDVNVDFGQMYGAINTIVLSRSGESDNIYYPETLPENPIEIKIKDNQIMNWNDRSDYLPGIYNALNGLYYYINDFASTGILYYDVGDLYNIQVEENTYQCLMLNDEINITTGIEEIIHTDLPEQSETDYTKADKTDRRINQTYLIVDKQNQQIKSLITTQTDQNQKIARVTQTVDELNSKISDIADITTSLETNSARLEFEGINQSEPIRVVIHPVGVNISKLYPSTSLKPSTNLTIKTRILRFTNTTTEEVFDYELPDDLLYYDSENYDEFQLDYDGLTCIVNKKCKWNNDGTVGLLTSERTDEYTFPHIELTDGNYIVQLIQYSNGYIFARLMAQNIYTTQFATKAELNSDIRQTVDNINLSVNQRLTNYSTTTQMNSAIDLKANQITQTVSETYVTNQTLQDNYSTTQQTSGMISATVSSMTKNNLETVTVEYALGTSTTTAPTSGWSTTAPTWQQGKYMWQRTKTKTADGTESISNPTCIAGATGASGVSISSITEYYAVSSSNSSAPADSAFKTTMQTMTATNKYLWNYEVITYSNNNTQKTIKRVIGTYGDKGTDGTNGIGIKSVTNKYQVSTSNTTAPTTWKDTPQTMTPTNKYLWNYEIITYSDNTTSTSTPAVIGAYGDKGNAGTNGVSVSSITEYYAVSSSNSTAPADSAFKTTMQTMSATNKYLWNYEIITFSNSTTQNTNKRVIGVYGDKGQAGTNGTNGIGISSIVNKYAVSSSNSTAPSSWSNTPQTMTATNKYLWNYEIITYSNNTTYTSTPAVIGTYGEKGNTGDTGKGVKAVVAQYYLSSSKTSQTGGSWSETQPTYRTNYYYWTRTKITWTDNTTTYTTPILVEEINSLNESVASLNIRAGNIESTVRTKVGNDEIISKINQSAEAVQIDADKISLNGKTINLTSDDITINSNNFSIDKNGNITATGGTIGGFGLSSDNFETELNLNRDYTTEDSLRVQNIIMGNITPTQTDYEKYDFNNDEKISGIDLYWVTRFANNLESKKKKYVLDTLNATKAIQIFDETLGRRSLNLGAFGSYINYLSTLSLEVKNGPSIRQGGIEIPTTVGNISIGNMNLDQVDYSWLSLSNTNNGNSVDVSNDFIQFWTGNGLPTLVYSGVALYENNSGSTGTITLRDYAYNYDFLEIYFADHNNGNIKQMIKVENPDGKNAQMQILSQSGIDIRVNVQRATISGKTITKQYGQVNYMRGGNYTTNEIYIEKVIGYRSGYPDY